VNFAFTPASAIMDAVAFANLPAANYQLGNGKGAYGIFQAFIAFQTVISFRSQAAFHVCFTYTGN
jgi:hypothetical protein